MQSYFVQLGSTLGLAYLELSSAFDAKNLIKHDNLVICESDDTQNVESLVEVLGGVVKGGRVLETKLDLREYENLISSLAGEILQNDYRKFGLSCLGDMQNQNYTALVKAVKHRVKELSGASVGYVWPKGDELVLNAAQYKYILQANNGVEFLIYFGQESTIVGVVTAVQPVDLWSEFDFGRPERRIHEGMLPAKVARMMLNIGVGKFKQVAGEVKNLRLLDPFCGSGTVLSEAMRLGHATMGLDNASRVVESAQLNLAWTKKRLAESPESRLRLSYEVDYASLRYESKSGDAVHISEVFKDHMVDVVVTEPYMGPLFNDYPSVEKARNVVKGLQKLYLGFFKSLSKVMRDGGVIVFAVPIIRASDGLELEVNIVDRLGEFGYTLIEEGVVYSRLGSIVKRKIVVFRYGTRQSSTYSKR